MRLFQEISLASFGLIKLIHDVINLSYYKHSTEKWKYIPYISVTHKVLISFRSKMVVCAHDVCKVHGASSSYMKTCCQTFFICICILHLYESLSPAKNLLIPHPPHLEKFPPPNLYSLTIKSQFSPPF